MPEIDESGGMPGASVVHIDVSGLDAFAASVEAELETNFQPLTARLMKLYEMGSHFGIGHASTDVAAAQRKHNECLRAAKNNMTELAKATQALAVAARAVATRYRASDALASSNVLEVGRALIEAAKTGPTVASSENTTPVTSSTGPAERGPKHE